MEGRREVGSEIPGGQGGFDLCRKGGVEGRVRGAYGDRSREPQGLWVPREAVMLGARTWMAPDGPNRERLQEFFAF